MKFNIRLNIQAIIRYEQLTGKPFSAMNYTDEADMNALLYVAVLSNNPEVFTWEEFEHLLENKRLLSDMTIELQKSISVMGQFVRPAEGEGGEEEKGEGGFIKDVAAMLIADGVSAEYVLHGMSLCDLSLYVEAFSRKKREQMEASRLWTFLTILPHVDAKAFRTARDLYPFPWEVEEMEKEASESIRNDADNLQEFLKQGKSFIKKGDQ